MKYLIQIAFFSWVFFNPVSFAADESAPAKVHRVTQFDPTQEPAPDADADAEQSDEEKAKAEEKTDNQ